MTAQTMTGMEACVFDAYGTLFDVSSVARGARDALGEQWQPLSDLWRTKQLQYTGCAAWLDIMPTFGKSPAMRSISP